MISLYQHLVSILNMTVISTIRLLTYIAVYMCHRVVDIIPIAYQCPGRRTVRFSLDMDGERSIFSSVKG